jgi:hypothetical protein
LNPYAVSEPLGQSPLKITPRGARRNCVGGKTFNDLSGDQAYNRNRRWAQPAWRNARAASDHYNLLKYRGRFQTYFYARHLGLDPNAREQFKHEPWYQLTVDFCAKYGEVSFDPAYRNEPISTFAPMVHRVLNKPWAPSGKACLATEFPISFPVSWGRKEVGSSEEAPDGFFLAALSST